MKLIFKGKTTSNDEQLQKLGLKETDFLVLMNQVAVALPLFRNPSPSLKLKAKSPRRSRIKRKNRRASLKKRRKHQNPLHQSPLKPKLLHWCRWDSLERSVLLLWGRLLVILIGQFNISLMEFLRFLHQLRDKDSRLTFLQVFKTYLSSSSWEPSFKTIRALSHRF